MPKRTKREKIIAEYRKRMRLLQQMNLSSVQSVQKEEQTEENKPLSQSLPPAGDSSEAVKKFFIGDLKKSFIFIIIIIALEIIVYFGTISKYFGFLR